MENYLFLTPWIDDYSDCILRPSSRNGGSTWVDSDGLLWLFGGNGVTPNGNRGKSQASVDNNFLRIQVYLNDFWNFNTTSMCWKFVGGSVYGESDENDVTWPYSRRQSHTWIDNDNNLCLFGGEFRYFFYYFIFCKLFYIYWFLILFLIIFKYFIL